MNADFHSFSAQHFSTLFILGAGTVYVIRQGKRAVEELKLKIVLVIAGLTFSSLLIETIVKLFYGTYDVLADLPLFLCDIVAIMLPFILYTRSRKWMGILYFWAMAGTIQALLTPDLKEGFPSFDFFRYFTTHAGIVIAVLYTVIVWNIKINWKDFINAVIYAQVYLVCIHLINHLLGSNYCYTLQKPQTATILDYLGAWPWYIFWGEIMMITLFLLLLIPFLITTKQGTPDQSVNEGFFQDL